MIQLNLSSLISVLLVFMGSMFFASCGLPPQPVQDPASSVYQSKTYVLYPRDRGVALENLARQYYGSEKDIWRIEDAHDPDSPGSAEFITIPLKEKNKGGLFADGYQAVPILCYHKFLPNDPSPLNTPPDIFRQQLTFLKDNGFRTISPDMFLNFLRYRRQIPKKAVMITIDDGFKSGLNTAAPILLEFGFSAVFFVYTDYIGVSGKALTWQDLRQLKADGFYIGSHSTSHSDLSRKLEEETNDAYGKRLYREIVVSKQTLDRKLNQNTTIFSFPYGRYNKHVMALSRKAGYEMAVSVVRGGNPFFSNPLALKRDMILKKDIKTFKTRLHTFTELSLK
ncbi:polysaccharide deacetylase family protein [Desulfobacter curvatus]|uniref:polysaccharide deacetylase family protein n=1 Tax=Desulfobacter curvatus TaxID=2290 RepID=UPI000A00CD0A|nr:polysaccharide deacetylase family protein [Desulfobacter curvatus]